MLAGVSWARRLLGGLEVALGYLGIWPTELGAAFESIGYWLMGNVNLIPLVFSFHLATCIEVVTDMEFSS
ncbi:hypothetical protein SLA2020_364870 [Shorea laevis]